MIGVAVTFDRPAAVFTDEIFDGALEFLCHIAVIRKAPLGKLGTLFEMRSPPSF